MVCYNEIRVIERGVIMRLTCSCLPVPIFRPLAAIVYEKIHCFHFFLLKSYKFLNLTLW